MRQIDNMTPQEIETLRLKGMLGSKTASAQAIIRQRGIEERATIMTREERLEATLIGIKQGLQEQGGYDNTIAVIDAALEP